MPLDALLVAPSSPPLAPPAPGKEDLYSQLVSAFLQRTQAKDQVRAEQHRSEQLAFADSQISSEGAKENPASQVDRLTRADISSLIETHNASPDLVTFLRAVLDESSPNDSAGLDRCLWVFEAVMAQLGDGRELARRDEIVSNLLLGRSNSLPNRVIAALAESAFYCVRGVANRPNNSRQAVEGVFELLTKLVHRLQGLAVGMVDPDARCRNDLSQMSGEAYRSYVIAKVCHERWNNRSIVGLVSSLRDLCSGINANDADAIKAKVVSFIEAVPEAEFPAFTFEALLLSVRTNTRDEVFSAILEHLEQQSTTTKLDVVLHGQILSQFNLVVSQDAQMGTLLLKSLEDSNKSLSVVCLGFLLSLGRVKRFQARVVELIKRRALAQARLDLRIAESSFLSTTLNGRVREDITGALTSVTELAHRGGWDLLVPMLLELGVKFCDVLPESNDRWTHPVHDLADFRGSPEAVVASMGVDLVAQCFRLFALERGEILSQITSRALVARGHPVQFVRVLNKVAGEAVMFDLGPALKELATLVPSMAPRVAHTVLRAMESILGARRDLRDHTMIVLRKAMFQRDIEPRIIALFGLFAVHASARSEDIVGPLCRAMAHQADVRAALYSGLGAMSDNIQLLDQVLAAQRDKYFDHALEDRDYPPYDFDEAIDPATGTIVEPIACLIRLSALEWARVEKLSTGDLTMFNLSPTSDFDPCTITGAKNLSMVSLVLSSCEALMDKLALVEPDDRASNSKALKQVAGLFNVMMLLRRRVKQKEAGSSLPRSNKASVRTSSRTKIADDGDKGEKGAVKKKKKPKTEEEVEEKDDCAEDSCGEDGDMAESEPSKKKKKSAKPKKKKAAPAVPPPAAPSAAASFPAGNELSSASIIKLLGMISPQTDPPANTGSHDFERLAFDAKAGFAEYMIVAATARAADTMRIQSPRPLDAKMNKVEPDARREWSDMALLCAGGVSIPLDIVALTPILWRLLRAFIKLDKYEAAADDKDKDKKKKPTKFYQQLQTRCLEGLLIAFKAASRVSETKVALAAKAMFPKKEATAFVESLHVAALGLHELCDAYVVKQMNKNAVLSLQILDVLLSSMPSDAPVLKEHVDFAEKLCRQYSVPVAVCKELIELFLDWAVRQSADGLKNVGSLLAGSVRSLVVDDGDSLVSLRAVNEQTQAVVLKALLGKLNLAIDECDCIVDVVRASRALEEENVCDFERAVFCRFAVIAEVLRDLAGTPNGPGQVRTAVHLFKALTKTLKEFANIKRVVDVGSLRSMLRMASELANECYNGVQETDADEQGIKAVNELVFNVEMFDVALVKLAKVVPSIESMAKPGNRKMRDFKISYTGGKKGGGDNQDGSGKARKKRKAPEEEAEVPIVAEEDADAAPNEDGEEREQQD